VYVGLCMDKNDLQKRLIRQEETIDFADNTQFFPSNFKTHTDEITFLHEMGFATNPYNETALDLYTVVQVFEDIGKKRMELAYPIDSLVVKLDDTQRAMQLGVVGKTPRTWCAMKYAPEEVTTTLLGISWQVGRTGKLTPVADLEPVELMGTVVKRATLHNYKEVIDTGFVAGDMVVIRKAGDIIPEVVQVLTNLRGEKFAAIEIPNNCPSCNTRLETTKTGVDLYCPNTETCHDQVLLRMVYYTQRNMANIVGLSEKIIERFIAEYDIHDIYDLYTLPWDEIKNLEGFGEKSVENLKAAVEEAKKIPDYTFLASLGIEGVGVEVAKLIVENITKE
jgi:DNA ligase (NAD+)